MKKINVNYVICLLLLGSYSAIFYGSSNSVNSTVIHLSDDEIKEIKKAADFLTPFFNQSMSQAYQESSLPYTNPSASRAVAYINILPSKEREQRLKSINNAYDLLRKYSLGVKTKDQILQSLQQRKIVVDEYLEPVHIEFPKPLNEQQYLQPINLDFSDEKTTAALQLLGITNKNTIISLELINDYFEELLNQYEEYGKYTDEEFKEFQKAYNFLKAKAVNPEPSNSSNAASAAQAFAPSTQASAPEKVNIKTEYTKIYQSLLKAVKNGDIHKISEILSDPILKQFDHTSLLGLLKDALAESDEQSQAIQNAYDFLKAKAVNPEPSNSSNAATAASAAS